MSLDRRAMLAGLGLSGLAIASPAFASVQGERNGIVRVGYLPIEVCAEVFYAGELGIFKKAGLDVRLEAFSSPGAVSAALVGNSIDIGLVDIAGLIIAHGHNIPLVYLTNGQLFDENAPAYSTIVPADSPLRDAKDFAGTFAVSSLSNIAALGTLAWVDKHGGDSKRIKFVESPFPIMADAVARHRVDAAVAVEPFLATALDKGLRVIAPHNGIAKSYVLSGWVTTRSWADSQPRAASAFARAIYEAGRWANRNHEASIPMLSKYTKMPPATIGRMSRGTFAESTNVALAQPVIDAAVTYGLVNSRFAAAELYHLV